MDFPALSRTSKCFDVLAGADTAFAWGAQAAERVAAQNPKALDALQALGLLPEPAPA